MQIFIETLSGQAIENKGLTSYILLSVWTNALFGILDTQGLQSPASRTGLSPPLVLTVANSAPGHYSRY
jgi:hypothetical protein